MQKPYRDWIEENNPWELSGPEKATFKTGAVDEAILVAFGEYIPQGISPEELASEADDNNMVARCPVHVAVHVARGVLSRYIYTSPRRKVGHL